MDGASDDAFGATRQPNGTAATQTPHSDAVANILAASPDWRIQAGPSPAATAGEVRGQAAAQAADAGQFVGQAAAQAADAGQFVGQAAAQAADAGQFVGQAASPALAIHHQGQAAAIANQSRSRSRSFATVEETQNQLSHGHPSPARPLPPIPTIVITTPDQRTHAPDSPTLHRGRQPAHRRLRRHELQNRVAELEQRIREMTDEAEAQEMVSEALWGEVAGLRARIREWEGVGERRVGES
ncbi:hypothetical protein GMDG_01377 [Pseudogymnoascus destructans 20631-21]|uniref:Uncharacterized protein n=1 Tax=Pseudogymnoascus destructans (strain ATCC MYA-4855 / 20631-21) TaxID=658429 RepID=L8FTN5_PSED2|nr:hypothetical protein GMDG_01377 [Pseudogymnoascus destructans 20631-21]